MYRVMFNRICKRRIPVILILCAVLAGDDQLVRLLLSHGANINAHAHYSEETALLASISRIIL